MAFAPPLGSKALSPLLLVADHLSSVLSSFFLTTRTHCSQMALSENGKPDFISLCNISRFKPSPHAALQDRGQQPLPFPFRTLPAGVVIRCLWHN